MATQLISESKVSNLTPGDLIMTGILSKVTAVYDYGDECTVFVEDVNGFTYFVRLSSTLVVETFPHLAERYEAMYTYMGNDDPTEGIPSL